MRAKHAAELRSERQRARSASERGAPASEERQRARSLMSMRRVGRRYQLANWSAWPRCGVARGVSRRCEANTISPAGSARTVDPVAASHAACRAATRPTRSAPQGQHETVGPVAASHAACPAATRPTRSTPHGQPDPLAPLAPLRRRTRRVPPLRGQDRSGPRVQPRVPGGGGRVGQLGHLIDDDAQPGPFVGRGPPRRRLHQIQRIGRLLDECFDQFTE
jgi:hypothetical protein